MRKYAPGFLALVLSSGIALAGPPDRWLHVKVVGTGAEAEIVRVNVPLELAEKALPTIHSNKLRDGKVKVEGEIDGVDLRALFDAIRGSPDNEFVTVEKKNQTVHIAKQNGYLLVRVREGEGKKVDVKLPLPVVEALLSAGKNELDVLAGLRALKPYGDLELVTVNDRDQTVRIWIDARNTSE